MCKEKGKCSACGAALKLAVTEPFAAATSPRPDVPSAPTSSLLLAVRRSLSCDTNSMGNWFPLRKVTITGGAVAALVGGRRARRYLLDPPCSRELGRLGQCDEIQFDADEQRRGWEATDDSGKINKSNLINGRGRVTSQYSTARGTRIWVITCLDRERWDHSAAARRVFTGRGFRRRSGGALGNERIIAAEEVRANGSIKPCGPTGRRSACVWSAQADAPPGRKPTLGQTASTIPPRSQFRSDRPASHSSFLCCQTGELEQAADNRGQERVLTVQHRRVGALGVVIALDLPVRGGSPLQIDRKSAGCGSLSNSG